MIVDMEEWCVTEMESVAVTHLANTVAHTLAILFCGSFPSLWLRVGEHLDGWMDGWMDGVQECVFGVVVL